MKRALSTLITFFFCVQIALAQQENPVPAGGEAEQQLENLAEQQNGEPEDDSYLQKMVQLKKNKLNINELEENDFKDINLISDIKIQNFLKYRSLLGSFISIYELQAIPGWDVATVRKVLPYVMVGNTVPFSVDLKQRLSSGQHSILIRWQQVLEKSNGFIRPDSIALRYPGSPERLFLRYKYNFKNIFQYGITCEKDAGEELLKGGQRQGFDFYSFHLFLRKLGSIKLLALGDFTVNLGQGLIHWQSLAFKKSSDITAVKRQGEIFHPYNSSGEYNFLRGAGITIGVPKFNFTAFASVRKLDGSFNADTAQTNNDYISSILNSGYHRTITEVSKKNAITQSLVGGNISYIGSNLRIGFNSIAFKFSVPLIRNILPYNQYAIQGKEWFNYSIDYSYTYANFHFFSEAAMDKNNSKAFVGGILASLDAKVDASLVYRNIEKSYQALYGNAFTESSFPTNERGLFTGISIKPVPFLKIDAYVDVFDFPWLRYRVDAPTIGMEYFCRVSYDPNKRVSVYTTYKNENKTGNLGGTNLPVRQVYIKPKHNWRVQVSYDVTRAFSSVQRIEVLWFDPQEKDRREQGFLVFADLRYKSFNKPYSLNGRIQYFETDGFESRLYCFENDVLYSYSIPQFIGKGLRYYINCNFDVSKKMTIWCRWAQTIYANQNSISSGLDKIEGNKRSEIKFQVMYNF